MAGAPGQLYEEPFVDYGATRNRILDLCRDAVNPIFTLMLSADEQVRNPQVMRQFLESQRHSFGVMHGAYPVVMFAPLQLTQFAAASQPRTGQRTRESCARLNPLIHN